MICEDTSVFAQTFCSVLSRRSLTVVYQDGNSLCAVDVGLQSCSLSHRVCI